MLRVEKVMRFIFKELQGILNAVLLRLERGGMGPVKSGKNEGRIRLRDDVKGSRDPPREFVPNR
jgi:hypothetical protein